MPNHFQGRARAESEGAKGVLGVDQKQSGSHVHDVGYHSAVGQFWEVFGLVVGQFQSENLVVGDIFAESEDFGGKNGCSGLAIRVGLECDDYFMVDEVEASI
jgi:hypothetical protein